MKKTKTMITKTIETYKHLLEKDIDIEIKEALKNCWDYHKSILQDADMKKSTLQNDLYDCELNGWEDVGYFVGYLRGLEQAKEFINK